MQLFENLPDNLRRLLYTRKIEDRINSRAWGCAHFNVFQEILCSRYKVKRRSTTLFQPDEYWREYILRVHTPFREENDSLFLLLLEHGAGIDSTFATGATPLWVAVNQPNTHLSQRLIANGADVHFANDAGNIILHVAATGYNEEVIRFLLVKGTNVHLKNVLPEEDWLTSSETTRRLTPPVTQPTCNPTRGSRRIPKPATVGQYRIHIITKFSAYVALAFDMK
ncbi:hypothetical protein I7I51_00179 [Histoplasma capsulatum]|uniref:Ankyrin repeat protein n=1 Tax=Ajellomyces capsulatus TaxID=5037 RepID=A0A8A1MF16_AJECA|nr:hypothetical protein I7I51_00179 [Histoplasma capsulatum]